MWANWGVDEFATWTNLQHGQIVVWANCITYSAVPARGLCPYDTRKRPHTMPVMLFAYNICQCPDNTRVGANCNSPIHCGQFALPLKAIENIGEFAT